MAGSRMVGHGLAWLARQRGAVQGQASLGVARLGFAWRFAEAFDG